MRWAVAALALVACQNEGTHDTLVAHAGAPVKLAIRRHDVHRKPSCRETGLNVYRCLWLEPDREGCLALEVGEPSTELAKLEPCTPFWPQRFIIGDPSQSVDFETDVAGGRFAWRTQTAWHVGYVVDGVVLLPDDHPDPSSKTRSNLPIDWKGLPTLDEAAQELYLAAPVEQQLGLLARIRQRGGDEAVMAVLWSTSVSTGDAWEAAFATLEPAHQEDVVASIVERAIDDGSIEKFASFEQHADLMPPDVEARLLARAREAATSGDAAVVQRWLERAYRKHDAHAGDVACQLMEWKTVQTAWTRAQQERANDSFPVGVAPYAVLAATRTPCRAVVALTEADPCSADLRCDHRLRVLQTDPHHTTEPDELCDELDVKKVGPALESDDAPFAELDAAARMGAYLANGPPSAAFALANARRHYTQLSAGRTDHESPCGAGHEQIATFVCGLRADQTRLLFETCQVEIDDARKTVRLTLAERDGGR